jgi:hypothetical protein
MPTAGATLLPPPYSCSAATADESSVRHLEEVGVESILGAMIEQKQRRASQPSYPALSEADLERHDARVPSRSEVFLKAR